MALGRGSAGQVKGTAKVTQRLPWRTIPLASNNGLYSDGNTIGLSPIDDGSILANISGSNGIPIGNTLSDILDHDVTSTQGSIIFRNGTIWTFLAPGTSGFFLQTLGAGADPHWAASSSAGAVGPPVSDGTNLFFALTDGNFPSPQIILDGAGNPIYVAVA